MLETVFGSPHKDGRTALYVCVIRQFKMVQTNKHVILLVVASVLEASVVRSLNVRANVH